MPHVDIERALPAPQRVVTPRLRTVLVRYAERGDVSLTLDLMIAGAAIAVPIVLGLDLDPDVPSAFGLRLRAAHHEAWFPTFRGELRNEPDDLLESRLRLDGTCEVPLGKLGERADRSLLGHAAERGLRAFVERVRTDVLDEIRRDDIVDQRAPRARSHPSPGRGSTP